MTHKTVDELYSLLQKDFEHDQAIMAFQIINFFLILALLVIGSRLCQH
jgi:hypothetical protein